MMVNYAFILKLDVPLAKSILRRICFIFKHNPVNFRYNILTFVNKLNILDKKSRVFYHKPIYLGFLIQL